MARGTGQMSELSTGPRTGSLFYLLQALRHLSRRTHTLTLTPVGPKIQVSSLNISGNPGPNTLSLVNCSDPVNLLGAEPPTPQPSSSWPLMTSTL